MAFRYLVNVIIKNIYSMETAEDYISRKSCIIVLSCFLVVLLFGCAQKHTTVELSVRGGNKITYINENGDHITAKYYSLSDSSLEFVKVTMPGSKEYTLPRVISASGVRYTDDFELVWWTKGNNAFAEVRDMNGQWNRKYDCKEIPNGK